MEQRFGRGPDFVGAGYVSGNDECLHCTGGKRVGVNSTRTDSTCELAVCRALIPPAERMHARLTQVDKRIWWTYAEAKPTGSEARRSEEVPLKLVRHPTPPRHATPPCHATPLMLALLTYNCRDLKHIKAVLYHVCQSCQHT